MGITVLFEYNLMLVKTLMFMVENQVGVDVLSSHADLEMHVVCRGTACASLKCNYLTSSDLVAYFNQVATIVTIEGGEPVHVAYLHAVAIAGKRFCHHHDAIEDGPYAIVRKTFDICAGMVTFATSAVGTDHLGFLQEVAPVGIREILQMKNKL